MKKITYLIICVFLSALFLACKSEDDFSSDKNMSLTFSSNTLSFDTVFSSVGSATRQFKIYNKNNSSLVIESIELVSPAKSGFRMNIDGEKGVKLTNVEILKKDSLYGFVEVTVDPHNNKSPLLIKDSIRFVVNGNIQYVQLEAVGQDVYIWKDKVVLEDTILTDSKPFLIYNSLTVGKNATLTIKEGVTFFMRNYASVEISGTLIVQGSEKSPVVFRGSRFDNIEGDIPYDNVPGQWTGLIFNKESYYNVLGNVYIRNAVRGMTFAESDTQYKKASLTNVIVQNTSEYGVQAVNCKIEGQNCLFANSKGALLSLQGGEYSFLHCTLANYYKWTSRLTQSLRLSNYVGIDKAYALEKCDFINSIIFGSVSKELLLSSKGTVPFNYLFQNCLLKSSEVSDNHFVNIVWNAEPLFEGLNINGVYSYNFELQSQSPAIDKADKAYSVLVPLDINGRSRLNDLNPDIGCYESVQ